MGDLQRSGDNILPPPGSAVFVSNAATVYEEGVIESVAGDVVVVAGANGSKQTLHKAQVFPKQDFGVEGLPDMCDLEYLHEPALIANLALRHSKTRIYTYVGSILIALNPYQKLAIYMPSIIRMYEGQALGSKPPHVFAIADAAYKSVVTDAKKKNQSILISGESGAGKTETAKTIMNYIGDISSKTLAVAERMKITPQQRVLATNPILEAFGNAKTVRNDNSSRFGKLCDLQLDNGGYICGAKIHNYLLESSRVVKQAPTERNFHVFYYVMSGVDAKTRTAWNLHAAQNYKYTCNSGCYEITGVNSRTEYAELKLALSTGGISTHEQHLSFTLLAAILQLGNISFTPAADEKSPCTLTDPALFKWVAYLLQVDVTTLENALLWREVTVGGSTIKVPLTHAQVCDGQHTLSKQLYSRNFDWMVSTLNKDMDNSAATVNTISLLDIFGFEIFNCNEFEQFCINYANERLQYMFNEHIFKLEKEAYTRDKVDVSDFLYSDNKPCLDLFEVKPYGLMNLLNEECRLPNTSDASYLVKLNTNLASNSNYKVVSGSKTQFTVHHYAGSVTYTVTNFLEKNRENLSPLVVKALRESNCAHFVKLFASVNITASVKDRQTLTAQFSSELVTLLSVLGATTPQYVRCIKPNSNKSPQEFDRADVLRQLRCSGVMDTIRIRRDGFPQRRPAVQFLERYQMLAATTLPPSDNKRACQLLLTQLGVDVRHFRVGLTQVFLKDSTFHKLEARRAEHFNKAAIMIQKRLRGYAKRLHYKKLIAATRTFQRIIVQYLVDSDCTSIVKEEVHVLAQSPTAANEAAQSAALKRLTNLCVIRSKNVETIVKHKGMEAIIHLLETPQSTQVLKDLCTQTLSKIAENGGESVAAIARGGAVKTMIQSILVGGQSSVSSQLDLLGTLASEEKNVGMVMREGGLDALQGALGRSNDADALSAAQSLGKLTKSRRVVKSMGRDHGAIKAVLDTMQEKAKFAPLMEYSLTCLANMGSSKENIDSIVELGGLQMCINAMKQHNTAPRVLEQCARVFKTVVENPIYAKMIGDLGGVELAIEALSKSTDACGSPALEILQSLITHPSNVEKVTTDKGVSTTNSALKSGDTVVVTKAMKLIDTLANSNENLSPLIKGKTHEHVLKALTIHTGKLEFATMAVATLTKLARFDPSVLEYMRTNNAVHYISAVMEQFPDNPELLAACANAMQLMACKNDLQKAMDTIGQSRMTMMTKASLAYTANAVSIISNLALVRENVAFIVAEGGIGVLLSVVNGTVAQAQAMELRMTSSGLRGLGRLLVTDAEISQFVMEGGVSCLVSSLKKHSDVEDIVNAIVFCTTKLTKNRDAMAELMKTQGLQALIKVMMAQPTFVHTVTKGMDILRSVCENNEALCPELLTMQAVECAVLVTHITT